MTQQHGQIRTGLALSANHACMHFGMTIECTTYFERELRVLKVISTLCKE